MSQNKNKHKKHTEVFQSFNIIVFGGDGDLALRKIFPAIFHREQDGQLLCSYNVVAITRNIPDVVKFNKDLVHFLKLTAEEQTTEESIVEFANKVQLIRAADTTIADYQSLANYLNQFPDYQNIYYFSTPSAAFGPIAQNLKASGLVKDSSKVVLEKPLGYSLESSKKINSDITKAFNEHQIYRIDHY